MATDFWGNGDVWGFFEGGPLGVRTRLTTMVLASIDGLTPDEFTDVESFAGLPPGLFQRLRDSKEEGNRLLEPDVVQSLAGCCRLDLHECFKPRRLSEEERAQVLRRANEEEFVALAATGDPHWSEDDRISLFLITTALRAPEAPAGAQQADAGS